MLFTELEKAHKGIESFLFLLWEPEENSVAVTEAANPNTFSAQSTELGTKSQEPSCIPIG